LSARIGLILLLFIGGTKGHALVPLESLMLGDFSEGYKEKSADPLDYIFIRDEQIDGTDFHKKQMSVYRGFYQEGANLNDTCEKKVEITYPEDWLKEQSKRGYLATAQYIALDVTSRAISQYAKHFKFATSEYEKLVDYLIGSHCSQNLSVISLKQLRKNLLTKFAKDSNYKLPTFEGNRLFSNRIHSKVSDTKTKGREFNLSVDVFKSFCSWTGESFDPKLMAPFVRNPTLGAFFIRQMNNKSILWNKKENTLVLKENDKTVKVSCSNLICRKKNKVNFLRTFPRSLGYKDFGDDLSRLYCTEFRDIDYKFTRMSKDMRKHTDKLTFDRQNLMVNHLISLLTGVPDLFIYADKYTDLKRILRTPLEKLWKKWAYNQADRFKKDLYYEESLTLELVNRDVFFNIFRPDFKVVFDVNMGEFDRVNQVKGKITTKFIIKLNSEYLSWLRNEWLTVDPRDTKRKKWLAITIEKRIKRDLERARENLELPLWRGNIENIVGKEIVDQLVRYRGDFFKRENKKIMEIPVEFNYAPFALKYMANLKKIKFKKKYYD
jgi:hypothetical protein